MPTEGIIVKILGRPRAPATPTKQKYVITFTRSLTLGMREPFQTHVAHRGHRILLKDRRIQMNRNRNTYVLQSATTVVILYTDHGRWAWERWDGERKEEARGKVRRGWENVRRNVEKNSGHQAH